MKNKLYLSISIIFSFMSIGNAAHTELHKAISKKKIFSAIPAITKENINLLSEGQAPLHLAVKMELPEVVTALISCGADVNLPSEDGEYPADIAYVSGSSQNYKILVEAGAYRGPPALAGDKPKISFSNLLLSSEVRDNFAFVYPLFFSDIELFDRLRHISQLRKLKDWVISEAIGSIAIEGFPNGRPSSAALAALDRLLHEVGASNQLEQRFESAFNSRSYDDSFRLELKQNGKSTLQDARQLFVSMDKKLLAEAYTAKEALFMSRITPSQLSIWLRNEHRAESITNYISYTNQIKILWSSLIVTAPTQDQKNNLACELITLARYFMKMRNYSGVHLISTILSDQTVSRMIVLSNRSKKRLSKLEAIANPDENFKIYHNLLKAHAKVPVIPIFGIFLKSLKFFYENKPAKIDVHWILQLASYLKNFHDQKIKASVYFNSKNRGLLDFLDHVIPITEDVVEAFALAERPDLFPFRLSTINFRRTLINCNASEMIKALCQLEFSPADMLKLLNAQIWSGKDLEKLFQSTKNKEEQKQALMNLGLSEESAYKLRYSFFSSSSFDV